MEEGCRVREEEMRDGKRGEGGGREGGERRDGQEGNKGRREEGTVEEERMQWK